MSEHTPLTEAFGSKLYEWLAEFGVDDASARARQVAESFVRDGWSLAARTSTATADDGLRERVLLEAADELPGGMSSNGARQWLRDRAATAAADTVCSVAVWGVPTDDDRHPCLRPAVEEWLDLTGQWSPVCEAHGRGAGVPGDRLRPLLAARTSTATAECIGCPPCPGRGNNGHSLTHCAECCFGTFVEPDLMCPVHGDPAMQSTATAERIEVHPTGQAIIHHTDDEQEGKA